MKLQLSASVAFRFVALACVAGLAGVAFAFFSVWSGLWLLVLAAAFVRRPWLGAAALCFSISMDSVRPVFGVFLSISELELAACLAAWSAGRAEDGREIDWRPLQWSAPFALAVLLSAAFNNEWFRVLPHVLRNAEIGAALLLAVNSFRDEFELERMKWALAAATLFYGLAGLLQFPTVSGGRIESFFDNPNQFAAYLNLLAPPIMLHLATARRNGERILWAAVAALAAVALTATQSRAAMAAGLIGVALSLLLYSLRRPARRPATSSGRWKASAAALTGVAAVAVALLGASGFLRPGFERAERGLSRPSNLAGRLSYLRLGAALFVRHPVLGVGPGNYQEAVEALQARGEGPAATPLAHIHLHNLYLQLAVDFGLLGAGAFLYLLWRLFGAFLGGGGRSAWSMAGFGILVAFSLHNLLDVTFPSLALETGLLLGVCLAGAGRRSSRNRDFSP